VAVSLCKGAINMGIECTLEHGLRHEAEVFSETFTTADQKEGMLAFIEKREDVKFQGV